jgi:tetratricopeptide (TPR) repeat protein
MSPCLSLALLCALTAAPAAPEETSPGESSGLAALLQTSDAAYARRDEPDALDEVRSALDQAQRLAPDDYELLWRLARLEFWMADDPALPSKEKSRLGKKAWEDGDRATRANPERAEGWNFAAAGMGNYALGIGVFQALRQGIEGKFKERLSRAETLDSDYSHGAIQTAWGRFWFELPWPKYNARKSERALRRALEKNPDNVRAHVYLADLYRKEGHPDRARAEMEKALAQAPGRYDAPEERRMQAVARAALEKS